MAGIRGGGDRGRVRREQGQRLRRVHRPEIGLQGIGFLRPFDRCFDQRVVRFEAVELFRFQSGEAAIVFVLGQVDNRCHLRGQAEELLAQLFCVHDFSLFGL